MRKILVGVFFYMYLTSVKFSFTIIYITVNWNMYETAEINKTFITL